MNAINTIKDAPSILSLQASGTTNPPSTLPTLEKLCSPHHFSARLWGEEFPITARLNNLRFVHIGKCGGTTLMRRLLEQGIWINHSHMKRPNPHNDTEWIVILIRNPLNRFVSAFNHSKAIIDFKINNGEQSAPTLKNCIAPGKISKKIQRGHAFSWRYEHLMDNFKTANELAESLSSNSRELRRKAKALMNHRDEHIFKGIGWHLSNGLFIEKHSKRILMVGTLENLDEDLKRLETSLGIDNNKDAGHHRQNSSLYATELSEKAIQNLCQIYTESDFQTIKTLAQHKLLPEKVLEDYNIDSP